MNFKSFWKNLSVKEIGYIFVLSLFIMLFISNNISRPSEPRQSKMDSLDELPKRTKQESEVDPRFNDDYLSNSTVDPRFNDDYGSNSTNNKDIWHYKIEAECLAAISEDDLDELIKLSVRKDIESVMLMVAERKAVILKAGTRVRRMSGGFLTCKIKILSGDYYGEELYLPCDDLKH